MIFGRKSIYAPKVQFILCKAGKLMDFAVRQVTDTVTRGQSRTPVPTVYGVADVTTHLA